MHSLGSGSWGRLPGGSEGVIEVFLNVYINWRMDPDIGNADVKKQKEGNTVSNCN